MSRQKTRRFRDEKDLLAALDHNFGRGNILVYQGSENFSQTVGMFKRACAVVGYHGAGALNMFFTPPGTLCLEVVIFETSSSGASSHWRPWRTNRRIAAAAGSKWQLKLVEPHHFWMPRRAARSPNAKHGDVHLTREHIADILFRLESHLERISHAIPLPTRDSDSDLAPVTAPFRIPDVRLGFR